MSDVTRILSQLEQGDALAAERLLPLVYEELRKLAGRKMSGERADHTLTATALVHEVYLRLFGSEDTLHFSGKSHFFAVAAEAMRRILVDRARRTLAEKRGGHLRRVRLNDQMADAPSTDDEVLMVHEALERLQAKDPQKAELVKLRYFAGCSLEEAAELLSISLRTAKRNWTYARAWLFEEIRRHQE